MDVGYLLKVAPAPPSWWASLTLDVGYLLRAALALHSHVNQYWPTCSCILAWRTLLPDREVWQATVSKVAKSRTLPKQPRMQRCKTFFACGSSAPVRVEGEGGTAAWLVGTLAAPSVQGHGLPPPQELWPHQSLFASLLQLAIRRPLWPVCLHSSTHSGT